MTQMDLYVDDMYTNLDKMLPRILDTLNKTNLDYIFKELSSIKGPTIVTGVGGSSVVGEFLAKVLNKKNHIIAEFKFPRELLLTDLSGYENVISISYSGRNIGVDASFNNNLKKYLFSGSSREGVTNLQYVVDDEEFSFVSMAGTMIPLSIIMMYYSNNLDLIQDILSIRKEFNIDDSIVYEVLTSEKSKGACAMLESTLVEGSLGALIIHEKYNYCHGRTLFNHFNPNISTLIYMEDDSALDKLFKGNLFSTYKNVITIDKEYEDDVVDDYYKSFMCLLLCMQISERQNKDMSIKLPPEVSELMYGYKGEM